jgi:zinc protease
MDLLNLEYEKYKLKNGLEIILYQNKSLPLVSVNLWYKTGSANERKGKTGIAHLFEHMMFQGSQNVAKEMHFRFIQEAGGSLNGSTSFDRTNYYEKLPSNFLELAFWLESDRMGYLLPALTQDKLKNQIDVVRNERLERYDNQPYGLAWEILIANLYGDGHPYSWPTIGFIDDINNYSLEDVSDFFRKYYSPSNASMVVAGDIEVEKTKELIQKYFGQINSSIPQINLTLPEKNLKENREIVHQDNIHLERLYLAWNSEKAYGPEDASFDILSDILSGSKSARLSKLLIHEKELVQDITAYQYSGRLDGHYMIIATAKPGVSLDLIKEEIFNELNKAAADGVTEKELIRSKNGIKSSFIYSMQNIDSLADHLNFYNFFLGEPNSFNYDLSRYETVDEIRIKKSAKKLLDNPYVDLRIIPKN